MEDARYFLHQALSTPCLAELSSADGVYIEDTSGRRYLDFHGNNVHNVGFSNHTVIAALKDQLEQLPFCTRRFTNAPAIALASKLARITPGDLTKCLFCPGGTDAMEIALKIARGITGNHKTISFWHSFHGASWAATSIGGERIFRQGFGPLMPGTIHVPPPDIYRCPLGYRSAEACYDQQAQAIRDIVEAEGDIGAVIAEPVRSTSAVDMKGYWQQVRQVCDEHGVLLIFDEITTGLGRTGKMFACEHFGVVPDILVLGKSLGGGVVPLAAVVARTNLDAFPERALGHYTHEKNPLLCRAGLATLEVIETQNLVQNAAARGAHALERLAAVKDAHELVGDVRGMGLLLAVELVRDRSTKEPARDEAEAVMYRALEKGLCFKVTRGNVLVLTPPLTITTAQMDRALDILTEALREVEAAGDEAPGASTRRGVS